MHKKDRDFNKLQKEWYAKLKDDGFEDIEGGTEGHLLRGPTPSFRLGAVANALGGRLSRTKRMAGRPGGSKEDNPDHWLDHITAETFDRGKSTYYSIAQKLATMSYLTKLPTELKFAWSLHSDGEGEEVIAQELYIPRSRARRYLKRLRETIHVMIDNNPGYLS